MEGTGKSGESLSIDGVADGGASVVALGGNRQRRTAGGPPPAPKLVRRTFLGDLTTRNAGTQPIPGQRWSIKIHDFGKQWVESSWGRVEPCGGKKGHKGLSPFKEHNAKRANARATEEIRRKCLSIGADHLVTLTYRQNNEDRDRVLSDLERLRRMLSRVGYPMPYVAVLECQKRGAIHTHLAVRGFQDVRLLPRCWYKVVGKGGGQVNVKGPRPGSSPVKLARYISKYISKDLEKQSRDFEEHRYFCSLRIQVPTERLDLVLIKEAHQSPMKILSLMLNETDRRIGDGTVYHWLGGGGCFGWVSGFQ